MVEGVFTFPHARGRGLATALVASALVAAVGAMCRAVGLELSAGGDVPADVAALAGELDAARAAKDFARADAIRAQLQADGWTVETTRDGTVVRR